MSVRAIKLLITFKLKPTSFLELLSWTFELFVLSFRCLFFRILDFKCLNLLFFENEFLLKNLI